MNEENITLYFSQGSSDKVYKASLEKKDDAFIVNFAYGRRGSTLKTGTKTQTPVPYEKAKKAYDKLINDKAAKGYKPTEDNAAYTYDTEKEQTGIHCQLLNPIETDEANTFINDNQWWAQEKMDGRRMLIKKEGDTVKAINRKGFSIGAPELITNEVAAFSFDCILDGEAIGETLFVFDVLSFKGENLEQKTYEQRYQVLESMLFKTALTLVKAAKSTADKETLYQQLQEANAEGIVFKKTDSVYESGRPNSGGNQLKLKFYDTASVIVDKINDKRSVGISVFKADEKINVGNVTIAVNKEIPQLNDVIEVRYLYAYKNGSLYQPTFLMVRTDIPHEECTVDQLKYKPE